MKNFIFTNTGRTVNKEYKTDFISGQNTGTIHDIKTWGNLSDEDFVRLDVNFRNEPVTLQQLKANVTVHNEAETTGISDLVFLVTDYWGQEIVSDPLTLTIT